MITYPKADVRVQWFGDGGPEVEPQVIVLHTTESAGWPGYEGGGTAPHLTVMPLMTRAQLSWRQHFPLERSARALAHPPGTVETNNRGAIQVELVGTCVRGGPGLHWPSAPPWALRGLAQFVTWAVGRFPIPLLAPATWPAYPVSAGRSVARFTPEQWLAFRGICGHLHVPHNTHGDPGAFPIGRLIDLAQGEDMPLSRTDLDQIVSAVWSAQFGPSEGRESAGQRLAHAATREDLEALEQRLLTAIKGV
jgi:hypothetical protein